MPLTITPRRGDVPACDLEPFEQVVRDVLRDVEEPLEVQFGSWPGEAGRAAYVCKVESTPSVPFGLEEQWRWWSPIVNAPQELREHLREALTRRQRRWGGNVPVERETARRTAAG